MSNKGDCALEQEKYSSELIEKANNEKEGLLKLAKEMAAKEVESYNDEKREECDNKITDLNSNDDIIKDIQTKSQIEIETLNNNFNASKEKVIDFLFKNVVTVKYEVPDVVKGCFEEKFGIEN